MITRGGVYDFEWQSAGRHPVVVVTRQTAIPVLNRVAIALVTSTVRGLPTEVPLGKEEGLRDECVVNCDNILTVSKAALSSYRGSLGPTKLRNLNDALRIALGLD